MAYAKGGENQLPVSLPGAIWPMPLEKFGGTKAEAPSYLIGKGVEEHLQQFCPPNTPDENIFQTIPKSQLPIVLTVENDITDPETVKIISDLNKWGFDTVRLTRPDVLVVDYYNKTYDFDGLAIVSSNGKDITVSLFSKEWPKDIIRKTFEGRAADDRVENVALKIWDQVKDLTFGLKYDTERAALMAAAEAFLRENKAEKNDMIRLSDNDTYQYVLTRKMLTNLPASAESLENVFTDFMQSNGMADRGKMAVILRNKAIGNHYITESVTKFFAAKEADRGSLKDALDLLIANRDLEKIADKVDQTFAPGNKPIKTDGPVNKPVAPTVYDPVREPEPKCTPKEFIPVEITARIDKVKTGFLKKKTVLHITIDLELGTSLPWDSVLCVQEAPLVTIKQENVVRTYDKGKKGPFALDLDLPLPQCPKAKKLRVYFKPAPDEPIGINNAYVQDPVTVNVD